MRSIIPKEYREKIFYQNAIDAYKLTPEMLNPATSNGTISEYTPKSRIRLAIRWQTCEP